MGSRYHGNGLGEFHFPAAFVLVRGRGEREGMRVVDDDKAACSASVSVGSGCLASAVLVTVVVGLDRVTEVKGVMTSERRRGRGGGGGGTASVTISVGV